jgi:serine/threonine-protein phosphatase 6 regulatory ankyrin repeat subunit B
LSSAGDILERTPLWLAARNGHLEVVKILIDFDPTSPRHNSQDLEAPSPLWALALSNLDAEVKTTGLSLLATSTHLNARNTKGSTLLHRAAFTGDIKLTTLLLNAGADIQIQDNMGRYPLHYAALRGHEAVLSLLLTSPPLNYINTLDTSGLTPLMLAAGSNHPFTVRLLTAHGADSLLCSAPSGYSALYIACSQGHIFVAAYLLGQGADIDGADGKGNTCLEVAKRNGHGEMVRWLVRMGVKSGEERGGGEGGRVDVDREKGERGRDE